MRDFPEDHLQYREPEEFSPRCWNCGDEMWSSTRVFQVEDGHWFCDDCFKRWVEDSFDSSDLAEALGIENKNAGALSPEDMGE